MKLSDRPKIKYSKIERDLFGMIPRKGKINSKEILHRYYAGAVELPWHGRTVVVGAMRNLSKKIEANKEGFSLLRTPPRGPLPIEYSLVRK